MAQVKLFVKVVANTLLASFGWLRIKLARKPTLLILTYHRVLPEDDQERASEQPGMVTSPETLARHIGLVKKLGAEPIHLSEWLKRSKHGESLPRLAVAYTFDDGWRDNYLYAYPILKEAKVPATIFLVTQMIDTNDTFWPEQVLGLLTSRSIPAQDQLFDWLRPHLPASTENGESRPLSLAEADAVIASLKSMDDMVILGELRKLYHEHTELAPNGTTRTILSVSELKEMSHNNIVRYGAHTRHHYRLNRLNDEKMLNDEIVRCLQDLRSLSSSAIPVFCYPNGDITGRGEMLVAGHYEAACTTKTGWNTAGCNPYDLHRFNLHDGNSYSTRMLLATIGRGLL